MSRDYGWVLVTFKEVMRSTYADSIQAIRECTEDHIHKDTCNSDKLKIMYDRTVVTFKLQSISHSTEHYLALNTRIEYMLENNNKRGMIMCDIIKFTDLLKYLDRYGITVLKEEDLIKLEKEGYEAKNV